MVEEKRHPFYDNTTLEMMMNYFKQHDNDELLRYIKANGLSRHIDILEENRSA